MQDRELYEKLLGLEKPWRVSDMRVNFDALKVEIKVEWTEQTAPCPDCGKMHPIYDHRQERAWRHLDTMQFETHLKCRIPRIECPDHGVEVIRAPWAEPYSRFTQLFERLAIDVLKACSSQSRAQGLLRLSWDEVHHIQERAVARGLARRKAEDLPYLAADEKSFLKGHQYATILTDTTRSRVLDLCQDRKEESLKNLLESLEDAQRQSVRAVTIDMWKPYINAVESILPGADIVHDKFHVSAYLNEAVDKVRKKENRDLCKNGEGTLKGTKYLWLRSPDNWSDLEKARFKDLRNDGLKVGRAWAMKEAFSEFWAYVYEKSARSFFSKWFFWATHSRMKPMIEVAKLLKRHLERILTYLKHRITNAISESINSKVQAIKTAARGFRNFENFRIAVLFHCGKLELYP